MGDRARLRSPKALFGVRGLLVAAAVVSQTLVLAQIGTATGPIDASGTWDIQLAGDILFSCGDPDGAASVMQSGTSISFNMACVAGDGTTASFDPSGTIDTTTGAFAVLHSKNFQSFSMTGTVDKNGDGMSGSWTLLFAPLEFEGTFTGSRQSSFPTATPVPPTDTPVPPADTPAPPVGGIAIDPELGALALKTREQSGGSPGLLAGAVAAAATGVVALGAAWYARRRVIG